MKVRNTAQATASFKAAEAYYELVGPDVAEAFRADVRSCRALLADNPYVGPATTEPGVRRILTSAFRYYVYYEVLGETLFLIDIRNPRRPRLFSEDVRLRGRDGSGQAPLAAIAKPL